MGSSPLSPRDWDGKGEEPARPYPNKVEQGENTILSQHYSESLTSYRWALGRSRLLTGHFPADYLPYERLQVLSL